MATEHTIKNFTTQDIEKYHQGLLSSKERHNLEKAALDDPFLADALEGFSMTGLDIKSDIKDLEKRLAARTQEKNVVPIKGSGGANTRWLRIAAIFIFVAGAGALVYQLAFNKRQDSIAAIETVKTETPARSLHDSVSSGKTDTGTKQPGKITGSVAAVQNNYTVVTDLSTNDKTINAESKKGEIVQNANGAATRNDITAEEKKLDQPVTVINVRGAGNKTTEQPASTGLISNNNVAAKDEKFKEEADDLKRKPSVAAKKDADKDNIVNAGYSNKNVPDKEIVQNRSRAVENIRNMDQLNQTQLNTYRGKVTDANNNGVPFARVTNSDDNNTGTYTDAQGNFNLSYPDSVVTVQVRSVGFENTNIQLKNNAAVNRVVLQEERSLSEVVVSNQKPNTANRNLGNKRQPAEAEPADGWGNYNIYLANNLDVPVEYKNQHSLSNEVELSFEVDKFGKPTHIRVEKSLCSACDKEAIRLVKEGPAWKQRTKKGRTRLTIPFNIMNQ